MINYKLIYSSLFLLFFACQAKRNPTFNSGVKNRASTSETATAYETLRRVNPAPQKRGYNINKGPGTKSYKTTGDSPPAYSSLRILNSAPQKRGYDVSQGPKLRRIRTTGYNPTAYASMRTFRAAPQKRGYDITKGPKLKLIRYSTDYAGPMDREIKPPKHRQRFDIYIQKPNKFKKPKIAEAHKKQKYKPKYEDDSNIWH